MKLICAIIAVLFNIVAASPPPVSGVKRVPVIMYHSVCNTGVNEYVLPPQKLKDDFTYLSACGYTAVSVADVISFCEGSADLPPKPVVLTFDDGFYNNLFYVLNTASRFGFKITVGIVGSYAFGERGQAVRSPVYSYLNEDEIKEMYGSGLVEFANHSYDMHRLSPRKGVNRRKGEPDGEYSAALTADSEKCRDLIKSACGCNVNVFAYPFGSYCKQTEKVLKSLGYKAFLTCREGINEFKKGSCENLDCIMRYNRSGKMSTQKFFKKINVT